MTSTDDVADFFAAFVAPAQAPSPALPLASTVGADPARSPTGGTPPTATVPSVEARRGPSRRGVLVAMVVVFAVTAVVTVLVLHRAADGTDDDGGTGAPQSVQAARRGS